MNDDLINLVLDLKGARGTIWKDYGSYEWYKGLCEEIDELGAALNGEHTDSPDHELIQIASIALNWLDMRGVPPEEIRKSLRRHLVDE